MRAAEPGGARGGAVPARVAGDGGTPRGEAATWGPGTVRWPRRSPRGRLGVAQAAGAGRSAVAVCAAAAAETIVRIVARGRRPAEPDGKASSPSCLDAEGRCRDGRTTGQTERTVCRGTRVLPHAGHPRSSSGAPGTLRSVAAGSPTGTMNEEEQFVNIDLNDDNVCSVCKLGTDQETLSFCHICFELNLEGVRKSNLLHTKSLRGHKDCFEKYHLIANQDCSRSKLSKSTYEGVKTILSKKINWIVQYAQNKDMDLDSECSKNTQHHLFNFMHKPDKKLLPQFDSPVPKYSAKGIAGNTSAISSYTQRILDQGENTDFGLTILQGSDALWPHKHNQAQKEEEMSSGPEATVQTRNPHYSREELNSMTLEEVEELNTRLQQQIQGVFDELTQQVQEKDSLASELHVRHVAIEQLLKNYSKLPCLQVGRAGTRSHLSINN